MILTDSIFTSSCDIYRPFGAGWPTTSSISCRLIPSTPTEVSGLGTLFSDYIDLDESVDIRDGCTRTAGTTTVVYADGDEVRIPNASGTRYVVTWVVTMNRGTRHAFKRAYLLRDTAVWPGP